MTSDGTWTLTWDAENCLKCSVNGTRTLEHKYDYLSRRVEKKVIDSGTTSKYLRFVYDDYKFIEELDALNNNAIRKKIVWNGDTPFSITDTVLNATYYYVLDANKNVTDLIDSSGNIVAHYEYSPFGKITAQSGAYADENPLRFSSEYFDNETGLVYYNYRYYSPDLGRWINRDPLGEEGGSNIYMLAGNNAIDYYDINGLLCPDKLAKCIKMLNEVVKAFANDLQKEIAKYDPVADGKGGWPTYGGKLTKPGGHYKEIQDFKRGLKKRINNYVQECLKDDDPGPKAPGIPDWIDNLSNYEVPKPVLPREELPWWAKGGATVDDAIGISSKVLIGVGVTAAATAAILSTGGAGTPAVIPAAARAFSQLAPAY